MAKRLLPPHDPEHAKLLRELDKHFLSDERKEKYPAPKDKKRAAAKRRADHFIRTGK